MFARGQYHAYAVRFLLTWVSATGANERRSSADQAEGHATAADLQSPGRELDRVQERGGTTQRRKYRGRNLRQFQIIQRQRSAWRRFIRCHRDGDHHL